MDLQILGIKDRTIKAEIKVSGSKSESNRLLILKQLFPELTIENLSDSDDTNHMLEALSSNSLEINIGHAGTAMRFLTAYFASQEGKTVVLSGSDRMHNRPIGILVEALRQLGAQIDYLGKDGYPPLQIKGTEFKSHEVLIDGNVSSQYISALLLIAPSLPKGLVIRLQGKITSVPYIEMTLSILAQLGIDSTFSEQVIEVEPTKHIMKNTITVESDWSSASYFYSIIALAEIGSSIVLHSYKRDSMQGDSVLSEIYKDLGVSTTFEHQSIRLTKVSNSCVDRLHLDLNKAPDIAQTLAVTCFGLGVYCELTGLHTLKIKETDRLSALKVELEKLGATIEINHDSLRLEKNKIIHDGVTIETYNDHRMAMAFAPVAMLKKIRIRDAEVVTKSFRNFWEDLKKIGFILEENK